MEDKVISWVLWLSLAAIIVCYFWIEYLIAVNTGTFPQ